ncbi:TOMM precursor leader peptide-binding protein [Dictyobacter aurantiacus]|uniref:YcaO domain-containing protein n=1 Tax=Dictyobacter aurantiacus TaxID=1936993 RepID=A0A401ZMN1_9CHLR|nr:TOMM precursor leader peptide-binding protein [Dictyobacter aurantiacus]GCE08113.1 hypothetical protein KDAU_54420 [Dictyobacter aurantiacus]
MLVQNMHPKWRADTYFIPMPDGVYLRGNSSRLFLKGKSLFALLERLVPMLDGSVSIEELTDGLDTAKKRMITNLLEKLLAHDFLTDTSQDQPHTLRSSKLESVALDIAFLAARKPSAASRFERFCRQPLLLIGSGASCIALIKASIQCGVKKIDVLITPEGAVGADARQMMLDFSAENAPEQTVRFLATPSWNEESAVRDTIQAYDALLHVSERPMLARALLLNRLCLEQRKTFMQAVVVDDRAWLGPLVSPEAQNCWECAWRRLQANLSYFSSQPSHYEFEDQPLAVPHHLLTAAGSTMLANRLIFTLFQSVTQSGSPEIAARLSTFDLATFEGESHTFLPHPHCLACQQPAVPGVSQFLQQMQSLQNREPTDPEALLENIGGCVDKRLGIFTAFEYSDFAQAPLAVYQVHSSNPLPRQISSEPFSVVALSTQAKDACVQAAQKACARYAASMVDRRRLLSSAAVPQQSSCPTITSDQLLEISSLPVVEEEMWIWALDLRTQQAVLMSARYVFLAPDRKDRGCAAGMSWEEAICQALLDWCNYLTLEQVRDTQRAYPQVDLAQVSLTPEGAYLHRLLQTIGEQITVYDVTGTLRVPTFATCSGEQVIAYSTHCDVAQALSMGLMGAVQHYQATQFQQPDYALEPVPDFPAHLRGTHVSVPHASLPDAWPARREWLLAQLWANGFRAFALPLDHDTALARVLPFIVRVLVGKRDVKRGE